MAPTAEYFIKAILLPGSVGARHKLTLRRQGLRMGAPVAAYVDDALWQVFGSAKQAVKAAAAHIKTLD